MLSSMNNRMNLVAGPFRDGTWLVATAPAQWIELFIRLSDIVCVRCVGK